MGSGRVHGVSLYFGPVPLVVRPTLLNFSLLSKFCSLQSSEHGTSSDFDGFRLDLADFVAKGPYCAAYVMFDPSVSGG